MSTEKGKELLSKYIGETASEGERLLVEYWYAKRMFKNIQDVQPEEYDRIKKEIWQELDTRTTGKAVKINKLWPRIIAAAAVVTIVFGLWFYTSEITSEPGNNDMGANDITPGKNTATIILASGKIIILSDAKSGVIVDESKLTYNDGIITDISAAAEMTLNTPRGGTYQITLSDGTKVWLNAASSLTYTAALNEQGERRVKLEGEAYFEVAKDKKHPFIVSSNKQEVKVLGTHFNISSYADDASTKTTLLEGSVNVNGHILNPDQLAVNLGGKINVFQADIESVMAWKEGEFNFNNEELGSIMKKIARWYDVDVHYEDPQMIRAKFWGAISRFKNISDVLRMLEKTNKVQFKVEGRRIMVMK